MKSTVVPFRNGIMLSVACGLAESRGLHHVMIANHGGDHAIYPDCRSGFIDAMSRAMTEGTYDGISIIAPYTNITKGDIARIGARLGVDYSLTYSCYKGGRAPLRPLRHLHRTQGGLRRSRCARPDRLRRLIPSGAHLRPCSGISGPALYRLIPLLTYNDLTPSANSTICKYVEIRSNF